MNKKLKIILIVIITPFIVYGVFMAYLWMFHNEAWDQERIDKIELFIAQRDFEEARKLCPTIANHDQRELYLKKTNMAELNYLLDQNGMSDAYFLANELNLKPEFLMVLAKNVTQLLSSGQSQQMIEVLAGWTFEYSFNEIANGVLSSNYKEALSHVNNKVWFENPYKKDILLTAVSCNIFYNDEVMKFNSTLDGIMNYAIITKDADLAKKTIPLYRPTAKEKKRISESTITYQLVNTDKNAAIAKARANGIKL